MRPETAHNNVREGNIMRPETAHNNVRKCICRYIDSGYTLEYIDCKIFLRFVYKLIEKDKVEFETGGWAWDNRHPLDIDPDAYGDSLESEMMYISDRFRAPHRLNWLAYGLENNLF